MSVPDESGRPNTDSASAGPTLWSVSAWLSAQASLVFAGLTPGSVGARIKTLAKEEMSPTWGGDARVLFYWLLVWLLILLAAVFSPIIVLLQCVFQERRWRLVLLLIFVAPTVLTVVLLAVLATGMAGFQFGK